MQNINAFRKYVSKRLLQTYGFVYINALRVVCLPGTIGNFQRNFLEQ